MRRFVPCLLLLAACAPDEPAELGPLEADVKPISNPAADPGLIRFDVPEGWIAEKPANNMRKAQFRIPDKEKKADDAVLALFRFRYASGVDDNIRRWAGQMGGAEPKKETIEGKSRVTLADIEGTYAGDHGGSAVPNARMLGAIVETGGEQWFFKLVGPADTVGDWREEFVALLKEAHLPDKGAADD